MKLFINIIIFLLLALFILIISIFQIDKFAQNLSNNTFFDNVIKNADVPEGTQFYIYHLFIYGANTTDTHIAFDRLPMTHIGRFMNDVKSKKINAVMINNILFKIMFSKEDSYIVHFKIEKKCQTSIICKANNEPHKFSSQNIHVLGFSTSFENE